MKQEKFNVDEYYKQLVDNRLISTERNHIYQELVHILFAPCIEYVSPKTLQEAQKILQQLAQSSFNEGCMIGFKNALNISKNGTPIIVDKAQKQERKKHASKAGKASAQKRRDGKADFEKIFIQYKMHKMTHKDILNHPAVIKKKFNVSPLTIDKKWIPECKKKRREGTLTG